MADIDAIRRGLTANLTLLKDADAFSARDLRPIGQVGPYLLENPSPPAVRVAGVESGGIEYEGFGSSSISATFLVEACLGLISDTAAQKLLNALMDANGATSLVAAVESDRKLTSRLGPDGTVLTAQGAAADSVAFAGFRGQSRFTLPNRTEVLLATWAVQVIAS